MHRLWLLLILFFVIGCSSPRVPSSNDYTLTPTPKTTISSEDITLDDVSVFSHQMERSMVKEIKAKLEPEENKLLDQLTALADMRVVYDMNNEQMDFDKYVNNRFNPTMDDPESVKEALLFTRYCLNDTRSMTSEKLAKQYITYKGKKYPLTIEGATRLNNDLHYSKSNYHLFLEETENGVAFCFGYGRLENNHTLIIWVPLIETPDVRAVSHTTTDERIIIYTRRIRWDMMSYLHKGLIEYQDTPGLHELVCKVLNEYGTKSTKFEEVISSKEFVLMADDLTKLYMWHEEGHRSNRKDVGSAVATYNRINPLILDGFTEVAASLAPHGAMELLTCKKSTRLALLYLFVNECERSFMRVRFSNYRWDVATDFYSYEHEACDTILLSAYQNGEFDWNKMAADTKAAYDALLPYMRSDVPQEFYTKNSVVLLDVKQLGKILKALPSKPSNYLDRWQKTIIPNLLLVKQGKMTEQEFMDTWILKENMDEARKVESEFKRKMLEICGLPSNEKLHVWYTTDNPPWPWITTTPLLNELLEKKFSS